MKIKLTALIVGMLLLTGCSQTEEKTAVISETSVTQGVTEKTEPDHTLMRGFTISEAYDDITAAGQKFKFPLPLSELEEGGAMEGCRFENGTLFFPDGSTAEAVETDGIIRRITFSRGTAPVDFSIMNITLGASYNIVYETGIPDKTFDRNDYKFVEYIGYTGQWIHLDFNDNILTSVSINETL